MTDNQKFYQDISQLLNNARKQAKTAVNTAMVYTYYEIGRRIVEEEQHGENRAAYGQQILQGLSDHLTKAFGKGYSVGNLKNIRQFYMVFSNDQIGETVFSQSSDLPAVSTGRKFFLSWSHYLKLMRIKNIEERHFYEIEAARNDWSLSELKRQYDSSLYERLVLSGDKEKAWKLAQKGQVIQTPADAVKDPYILEFLGLPELPVYSESELETRIIDHLQQFLLELGTGFAFVGRQVRFTFDEEHFRVDLVFYNRLLRCFVLFDLRQHRTMGAAGFGGSFTPIVQYEKWEIHKVFPHFPYFRLGQNISPNLLASLCGVALKIGELKHQDIGQMQMYVNYYDRKVKLPEENPTIGIVLCKDKNNAVVEMTLPEENTQIFASKYETVLPSKAELKKLLNEQIGEI